MDEERQAVGMTPERPSPAQAAEYDPMDVPVSADMLSDIDEDEYPEPEEELDDHGNPIVKGVPPAVAAAQQSIERGDYPDMFDVRKNFAEYAFARIIERHNLRVQAAPDGSAGKYITARQGRELRARTETILTVQYGPGGKKTLDMSRPVFGQVDDDKLREAIREACSVAMAGDPVWTVPKDNALRVAAMNRRQEEMASVAMDYKIITGGERVPENGESVIDLKTGKIRLEEREDGKMLLGNLLLPLSPYDPAYENYGIFRRNGGRILYALGNPATAQQSGLTFDGTEWKLAPFAAVAGSGDTVRQLPAGKTDGPGENVQLFAGMDFEAMDLWRDDNGEAVPIVENRKLKPAGTLLGNMDKAGLSLLRDYMTDREFEVASEWITAARDRNGNPGRVSDQMAGMAIAVCDEMRNRGLEFTIEPDRVPGQLKAKIKGTKKEVRLTDLSETGGYYIGRVYEGGNYLYWQVPRGRDAVHYYDKNMAVTNLLYGLGYPVARIGWDLYPDRKGLYDRIVEKGSDASDDRFTYIGQIGHSYSRDGLRRRMTFWTVNPSTGGGRMEAWAGVSTVNGGSGRDAVLFTNNDHQQEHMVFEGENARQDAAEFLQSAVKSAKLNFSSAIQVEELIRLARDAEPGDELPVLSNNPSVTAIQKVYWNVLTTDDPNVTLHKPAPDDEALAELTEAAQESNEDYDPEEDGGDLEVAPADHSYMDVYDITDREELVRQHLSDVLDLKFGGVTANEFSPTDLAWDDNSWKGFCPSLVSVYMRSGYGPSRNKEDLASAMRAVGFTGEEFAGFTDFDTLSIKDRLVTFQADDPETRSLTGENVEITPFMQGIRDSIVQSLQLNGCLIDTKDPDAIRIDKNGIVHYKAHMLFGYEPSSNERELHKAARSDGRSRADYSDVRADWIDGANTIPVEGEIGQIFEPDVDGLLETRYYGSKNKLMSPGYEAYVVMPKTGEASLESLPSRYRVRGLQQVLQENIATQIRTDLQNGHGFPTGLGAFEDGDREAFLRADTEEKRRALADKYHMTDDTFVKAASEEAREDFVKAFEQNAFKWSYQMDQYRAGGGTVQAGSTTSLNHTYRRGVYSTPYKLVVEQREGESMKDAYIRQSTEMMHFPMAALRKKFQTNALVTHFPKYLVDGSSVMEEYQKTQKSKADADGKLPSVHDLTNDNQITPYMLTGNANMAIQMENSHIILLEDKALKHDLTLDAGTVLTESIDAADGVAQAGTPLAEPVTLIHGGVLKAGTVIGDSLVRVPQRVLKNGERTAEDMLVPGTLELPRGTVPGGDITLADGRVLKAGEALRTNIKLGEVTTLPAGTLIQTPNRKDLTIKGEILAKGKTLDHDAPVMPGMTLPKNTVLAESIEGCSRMLPKGVALEEPVTLRQGTILPKGFRMRVFDPVHTGSGKNQGGTRYMVEGVGINAVSPVYGPADPRLASGELSGPNDALIAGGALAGVMNDDARIPLVMNNPDLEFIRCEPADRAQMTISNYMTALAIAGTLLRDDDDNPDREASKEGEKQNTKADDSRGVRVAQMTLGGFTFDDGAVISKSFADRYKVIGDDGELRPLGVGDKICDMSGNKNVVAVVVDPEMDPEEAEKRGLTQAIEVFKKNPDLDVVQSAYGAITRFSAASAKTGMNNDEDHKPAPLYLPEGSGAGEVQADGSRVIEGGILTVPMIVTKQTADEHVVLYDDEAVEHGKGRKVSAQMSWVLSSAGAEKMMEAIYGPDSSSFVNTREYFITLGYDMGPTGQVLPEYTPHTDQEKRFVFPGPDEVLVNSDLTGRRLLGRCRSMFGDIMDQKGGFMDVPFPLLYAGGKAVAAEIPGQFDLVRKPLSEAPEKGMYRLPVLSAHLRCGQEWQNGERMFHDYTNMYTQIYAAGVEYVRAKKEAGYPDASKEENDEMRRIREKAQRSFDAISKDIVDRRIDSKYGFARGAMMTRRMSQSATAIWTPDPTLDLGEIGVSVDLLPTLGVRLAMKKDQNGELIRDENGRPIPARDERGRLMADCDETKSQLLVTRDPVLDRAGVRSLKIIPVPGVHGYSDPAIHDGIIPGTAGDACHSIRGVQVNPLIAATYKGDFDGDSVGLVKLGNRQALIEQYAKFSIDQNMLDMTTKRPDGDYALLINVSMDLVSAEYYNPELTARRLNLEHAFNLAARGIAVHEVKTTGEDGVERTVWTETESRKDQPLTPEEKLETNKKLTVALSDYARDALCDTVATEAISFADVEAHMASLRGPVEHKAKGKESNLEVYAKYYGIETKTLEDGRKEIEIHDKPLVSDEDTRAVECATAYKAYGTGNAGAIQQLVVSFGRNAVLDPASRKTLDGKSMAEKDKIASELSVLDAALYITQGATQGLLQAKHDPVKARKFYAMINGPVRELFRGHEMEYKNGTWETIYRQGDDGRMYAKKCTPESWTKMARAIFKDPEKGLGLDAINDEHFAILGAAAAYNNGWGLRITDMDNVALVMEKGASPMDICAYNTPRHKKTVLFLAQMADCGMNMFAGGPSDDKTKSGGVSRWFMPKTVRENEIAVEELAALKQRNAPVSEIKAAERKIRALVPGDVRAPREAADRGMAETEKEPTALTKLVDERLKDFEGGEAEKSQARAKMAAELSASGEIENTGLYERRKTLVELYGLRPEFENDVNGVLRQDQIPGSREAVLRMSELKQLDQELSDEGAMFRPDFTELMNQRELATVYAAEQKVFDYMLDKGLTDWELPAVTLQRKQEMQFTPEETMKAAALIRGLRDDLATIPREGDAGRRFAGEADPNAEDREAKMRDIAGKLGQLRDMGYQQYMTVEADSSYGARCTGTVYVPRYDVAKGDSMAGLDGPVENARREAQAGQDMTERDMRREELLACGSAIQEHYGAFCDVYKSWQAASESGNQIDPVLTAQMEEMAIDMAERLALQYSVNHRDEKLSVTELGYCGGDMPDYDDAMAGDVLGACRGMAENVNRMFEASFGENIDESEQGRLARALASGLEMLDSFGYERSGTSPVADMPAAPEPEHEVHESEVREPEVKEPEKHEPEANSKPEAEQPQAPAGERGRMAENYLAGVDGSGHAGEGTDRTSRLPGEQ